MSDQVPGDDFDDIDPEELEIALRNILTGILRAIDPQPQDPQCICGQILARETSEACDLHPAARRRTPDEQRAFAAAFDAQIAAGREKCPICRIRAKDLTERPDARGVHWCKPCIDEHDSIDWDEVAERRMGML